MGSAMSRQQQPTTIVNNVPEPAPYSPYPPQYSPYPPPAATPTANGYYSNGSNYRPYFNGSQVVYGAP